MSTDDIDAMAAQFATDVLAYGSMIGVSHGEPLRAPNALRLLDPVAHFRHNGFSEAHAFEGVR
jgi:hypothetical protein